MAASTKKKKKKGNTISLTDFLTVDEGLVKEAPMSPNQSARPMKQTTWEEMFQQLGTVMMMMSIEHFQLTVQSFLLLHGLLGNPVSTGAIFPNCHPTMLFWGTCPMM
jgi:hypothetical protein